ncbi:MAG TPA: hypothetical protein VHD32_03665 [Candidatus Didemnitutus sp.]|nr:hypothetical protein [Candidatus Didemnitutus sp.]
MSTVRVWHDLGSARRRSAILITVSAIALFIAVRFLPTGTNLNHMDFRVEGRSALEFCDPANPQFIPVIAARSPVVVALTSDHPPQQYKESHFVLSLHTANGKPIAPEDLMVAHTRKLHLLVVDPTLQDYQHIHPEPGRQAGDWVFAMTPNRTGKYRVFADFTPVATQRGLYASADFDVPGEVPTVIRAPNTTFTNARLEYSLIGPPLWHARQPIDLKFRIESPGKDKQAVPLEPVMDAFAHLVAFDEGRSGFAHLHPKQTNLSQKPDALKPEFDFKVTFPTPGRYVIWAQVKLAGDENFVPFWIDVLP